MGYHSGADIRLLGTMTSDSQRKRPQLCTYAILWLFNIMCAINNATVNALKHHVAKEQREVLFFDL